MNTAGIISTIAGNGIQGYGGDGGQATAAKLYFPEEVILDALGNLYIADAGNNRIRKVNTAGVISTIVGNGTSGFAGDGGPATAAELTDPLGLSLDVSGNLYIADAYSSRIRKVSTAGIISTIVGNGIYGFAGDGGLATAAELAHPQKVILDAFDNLYIADTENNRIRKVNTAGIISTIAGTGTFGYSGDGGQATAAELFNPKCVVIDSWGSLYIADQSNSCIRMLNTAGTISTIAGNGNYGYTGDGGQATAAKLAYPAGVSLDALGNLYIADANNSNIRKVTNVAAAGIEAFANTNEQVMVYPNPNAGIFQVSFSGNNTNTSIEIYNTVGACVHRQITTLSNCQIDLSSLNEGIYNISLQSNGGVVNKRLVIVR